MRPISNVVDASNYVMLELGKPIHTFDADGVAERDGRRRIVVRRARPGERLETLDHVDRDARPGDAPASPTTRGPLGDRRDHGRRRSEVGGRDDPASSSSRRSSTRSSSAGPASATASAPRPASASRRARRSGSPGSAPIVRPSRRASGRAASVARGRVDTAPDEPGRARVAFRPARVNRLLGTRPAGRRAAGAPGPGRGRDRGRPPAHGRDHRRGWRRSRSSSTPTPDDDARRDRPDLAARHRDRGRRRRGGRPRPGYEAIPATLPDTPMPPWRPSPLEVRDRDPRDARRRRA